MENTIKFSDLKVGDILKYSFEKTILYIIVSDEIEFEHQGRKLLYVNIICRQLYTGNIFRLNRISLKEIKENKYTTKGEITHVPNTDLPLLINKGFKSDWFERALKGNIPHKGNSVYEHILRKLKDYDT